MHPNDGRVVSSFIAQALTNRPTTIFGGTQTRSFCYDDLVGGLMALMETADDVTGLINLGNPEEYRIRGRGSFSSRCRRTTQRSGNRISRLLARRWGGSPLLGCAMA